LSDPIQGSKEETWRGEGRPRMSRRYAVIEQETNDKRIYEAPDIPLSGHIMAKGR
jgi:hypothetical protein